MGLSTDLARALGRRWTVRLGTLLSASGTFLLVAIVAIQLGLAPSLAETLPQPVALVDPIAEPDSPIVEVTLDDDRVEIQPEQIRSSQDDRRGLSEHDWAEDRESSGPAQFRIEVSAQIDADPEAPPRTTSTPTLSRLDAESTGRPAHAAGLARSLMIPSIGLETDVKQGGFVMDEDGIYYPETLPFVAVHYGWHTAHVGGPGNAVIAGHVVSRREGNVFQYLHQVRPGDEVQVVADAGSEFRYRVANVKLVTPDAVEVMRPMTDARLTLITCAGTFDSRTRSYSHRLIVTALLE